jgi:hypothetical protein
MRLNGKVGEEISGNGFLTPVIPSPPPLSLVDEHLDVLLSSPRGSTSPTLFPQVFSFLFLNEFCLTLADFPLFSNATFQRLLETRIPHLLVSFVQRLSASMSAPLLLGKPALGDGKNVAALVVGGRKLTSSTVAYVDPASPCLVSAASNTSYSSSAAAISLILSSMFHSFTFSSLSALLNLVKGAEQTQLYHIIADEDVDLIGTIVQFVSRVVYFFLPSTPTFAKPSGSTLSPHFFPTFLVKAMRVLEVRFCCQLLLFLFCFTVLYFIIDYLIIYLPLNAFFLRFAPLLVFARRRRTRRTYMWCG